MSHSISIWMKRWNDENVYVQPGKTKWNIDKWGPTPWAIRQEAVDAVVNIFVDSVIVVVGAILFD